MRRQEYAQYKTKLCINEKKIEIELTSSLKLRREPGTGDKRNVEGSEQVSKEDKRNGRWMLIKGQT
jgi:hypothetical protein